MKAPLSLPPDYRERAYAGVLGKIIGVYLGRPFEGWSHREILEKLGEIRGYVHQRVGVPLVVTDDDISGTFTFLRALADHGYSPDLTAEQIGQTWMNYIVEDRTILWWGGLGMSTEHTAYLRMKHGIVPPASGSIETNGQVVAEQIGAQIFIDGWGLICPGDPERAASFAARAASVSHDGEAVYAAQVVAALVAAAFTESDIDLLLDVACAQIPTDCLIRRMIDDLRSRHAVGLDWRDGFGWIEEEYGYDQYGGNCHVVPNHAIVIHSLLHSGGSFDEALMIANTCGWDTDCNSGNVGCIMGVRNGLDGISEKWRHPVNDRMYLPTADGGRCITDAATETQYVVRAAQALAGLPPEGPAPRFDFSLPGSTHGFSRRGPRYTTDTFCSPEALKMPGYDLAACPTLYSGQILQAHVTAVVESQVSLTVGVYDSDDNVSHLSGPIVSLARGEARRLEWRIPYTAGYPIQEAGIKSEGSVRLNWLNWSDEPETEFRRLPGTTWKRQWVNGVSRHETWGEPFRLIQNEGTGLLITGCREWSDYWVSSSVTPHLVASGGIAARVQGMRRYYALELVRGGGVRLVKALDGRTELGSAPFEWVLGETIDLAIEVVGNRIVGFVNGVAVIDLVDSDQPLTGGGIALILTEGRMATSSVKVGPVGP